MTTMKLMMTLSMNFIAASGGFFEPIALRRRKLKLHLLLLMSKGLTMMQTLSNHLTAFLPLLFHGLSLRSMNGKELFLAHYFIRHRAWSMQIMFLPLRLLLFILLMTPSLASFTIVAARLLMKLLLRSQFLLLPFVPHLQLFGMMGPQVFVDLSKVMQKRKSGI